MNFRVIAKYMGNILMLEGAFMLPAIVVALIYKEFSSIPAFVITILLCLCAGFVLFKTKQNNRGIYAKEAYISVALGWIILSLFGIRIYNNRFKYSRKCRTFVKQYVILA